MQSYAADFKFEEAEEIKQKIKQLDSYQSKSSVVSASINNVDVFSIISDPDSAYINYFKVSNGSITQAFTTEIKKILDESDADILIQVMLDLRTRFRSEAKQVLVNIPMDVHDLDFKMTFPKQGDKKKLIDLCYTALYGHIQCGSHAKRKTDHDSIRHVLR